ncbi:MAG: hypothetical protein ACLFQM_11570 [Fidelibacterota bacterium]
MIQRVSLAIILYLSLLQAEPESVFKGQLIGAPRISYHSESFTLKGYAQYLPIFEYSRNGSSFNYSFDMAGNFYTNFESDPEAKLYRLKFGLSNNQTELRLGLQKLNFGPAQILRSLQWFDTMSPTDPLKLTDGVYGGLFRHYFMNNTNIWFWSLYGNDDRKGIERVETKEKTAEFGGRSQFMVFNGELGTTAHYRQLPGDQEYRLAMDGRWDYIVGSWFEGIIQKSDNMQTLMLTLGTDYTFSIGNGLYCMGEHLISEVETNIQQQTVQYSALMVTYPVTFFDNLSSITYYNWDSNELSQHISWQRTYNHVMLNLSLFHFPEQPDALQSMAGYGVEFKFIYNH